MEEQAEKVTVKQLGMKWGVILALISFAYFMILNLAGLAQEQTYGYVGYIFTIVIFVLAHKAYKEEGDGFMSLGEGFKIGAVITIISSIISSILTYVYLKFVDGSMLELIKDKAISDMEDQGMSEEQIDQSLGIMEIFMTAEGILIMGIIMSIIFGSILALVVSAFTKNADPSLEM
jgi:hypothetical protein